MHQVVQLIIDWSEVWALLIPICIFKKQPALYKPVVFYVWAALFINLAIDVIWKCRTLIPVAYNSNNYLYNIHSIIRFLLFSLFFTRLKHPFLAFLKVVIPVMFGAFLLVNFIFYEQFFNYRMFSSRLLSVEAFLMLLYVFQYYFFKINENVDVNIFTPDFWIVTGLGIYMAFNFFIFLLYNELTIRLQSFAISLWNVHNISFIVFNLFLAKSLNESGK
ncbi:hypothetical protein RG47T_1955 [Mucilaginibacter polytrichastri]|uniref:Uncharacterized protein n=1 Tax=Mucilaginibacter polytrichastri TaxID=1302689 RepID=A0A1Q5ZXL9_9SPHI|nr:hypothetical protein RG47T_1955 [Mucilaginibacter polytrichastri]SFS79055.1 hypothetical protein SAMN04487890_10474 [Mucilaginibacter polytrichastri]